MPFNLPLFFCLSCYSSKLIEAKAKHPSACHTLTCHGRLSLISIETVSLLLTMLYPLTPRLQQVSGSLYMLHCISFESSNGQNCRMHDIEAKSWRTPRTSAILVWIFRFSLLPVSSILFPCLCDYKGLRYQPTLLCFSYSSTAKSNACGHFNLILAIKIAHALFFLRLHKRWGWDTSFQPIVTVLYRSIYRFGLANLHISLEAAERLLTTCFSYADRHLNLAQNLY